MLHHRNPTLPSPLSSYLTEQHRPPKVRETPLANVKVTARKPTNVLRVAPKDSPRTKAPKDIALINSELELAEKRNKKAEQALASWEAALKYERKVQYRYLKERVKLQKQLIKQSDCYTQILREQAEQERQKEVKAIQQARKEMADALRNHEEKIRVHREKVTKKLQIKPDSNEDDQPTDENKLQTEESATSPVNNRPKIMNILNIRSDAELCVEDMWRKARAHSARKMRPVENHLMQLKRTSSPFIRDFLQKIESEGLQYDTNWSPSQSSKSTRSTTAKKIQTKLDLMRSAAQQNEHHAMMILCHNTPTVLGRENSSFDFTMYGFSPSDLAEASSPALKEKHQYTSSSLSARHKKKLPLFLTKSGEILKSASGSIDDRSSVVYHTKSAGSQNRTFLTEELSSTGVAPSRSSLWEPLTFDTLQEHKKVKNVQGSGPFQHGEPKLWRYSSPI